MSDDTLRQWMRETVLSDVEDALNAADNDGKRHTSRAHYLRATVAHLQSLMRSGPDDMLDLAEAAGVVVPVNRHGFISHDGLYCTQCGLPAANERHRRP
jgi:hypothetical protein